MDILFLGTGGGRIVMARQVLRTGGIRLALDEGGVLHIDPGPGALLTCRQLGLSPSAVDAVITTHAHPDHCTDLQPLIEAPNIERGEKPILVASFSILRGLPEIGPVLGAYHRTLIKREILAVPKGKATLQDLSLELEFSETRHTDPTTFGFVLRTDELSIGYSSDTELFEGFEDYFQDVDLMIWCCTRPANKRIRGHLCAQDILEVCEELRPKVNILTHFGLEMVQRRASEARKIESRTGVRTIAAIDSMKITLNDRGMVIRILER